jgi:hypothetical protein
MAKSHPQIPRRVLSVGPPVWRIDPPPLVDDPVLEEPPAAPFAGSPEGLLEDLRDALAHGFRRQLGITQRSTAQLVDTLLHPQRVPGQVAGAVEVARSLARQAVVTDSARSPLWTGRRSLQRRFEVLTVDLDGLKAVSNALGGTVNDGFVCGVAGGAGMYHRERGVEIDELRVSMPVNTRTDKSAGGNAFTPTRALVPAGAKDPVERFERVRSALSVPKGERGLGSAEALIGVLNSLLPTSLLVSVARSQVETVDFATSNLRGAPWDLFIAGAEILGNHPMGPTGGTAFNATVLSYRGGLDMGLNIDTAAIDDPGLLKDCSRESFDELLAVKV